MPVLVTACAFQKSQVPVADLVAIDQNGELIAQQQSLLREQAAKLDQLAVMQQQLGDSLATVQEQLEQVREFAEFVTEPGGSAKQIGDTTGTVDGEDNGRSKPAHSERLDKTVVGRSEWVWLDLLDSILEARIDTGVLLSSLSVENVQPFERNGEKWVSFQRKGNQRTYETPLVRYIKVRQTASAASSNLPGTHAGAACMPDLSILATRFSRIF